MKGNLIDRPECVFLVLALIFGLIFVFINPPFGVVDEGSHFYKAFDISRGNLIPKDIIIQIPISIRNLDNFSDSEITNFTKLYFYSLQPLNVNETYAVNISNIAIYPPLPYLASGFIIFLGDLFNFSPLSLMYFGRLVNLLIYIIIVYFGIKVTPIHKYVLLLVALMPTTLYQASSLSADSLNLALSFLTISFFLHLALVKDKIHNKDILISLILIFTLIFSKQAYALLAFLFFIIPKEKFKEISRLTSFLIVSLPSLISLIFWNLTFKSKYSSHIGELVSSDYNIHFILSNPLNFPTILINTLIKTFPSYITTFVGIFRWSVYYLPLYLIYSYCIILVIASFLDNSKYELSFREKIIPLFIFSVTSLSVFLFEFITYTPIDCIHRYKIIAGVQGRYFIPIVPLFLLIFYNSKLSNYISTKIKSHINMYKNILQCLCIIFIILYLVVSSYIIYYAI
ncbi:MAG: DUF2142 domain-containing protein [Methanobrevibacter sp.]|nr:DUF2142 domain-containing protein [Candidatus Methanovirga aequatorialis]